MNSERTRSATQPTMARQDWRSQDTPEYFSDSIGYRVTLISLDAE